MNGALTHWYDIAMIVVLLGTTVYGAWKGVAWQMASLASLVASTLVAVRFSGAVAPWIGQEDWARLVAMLILFLGASLVIWLLFRPVAGFIDRLKLKEWDRQAGGLFGLTKGILLCVVITFFAVTLSESARRAVLRGYSGRAVAILVERAGPLMPEKARSVLGKYLEELERKLDPKTLPGAPADAAPGTARMPQESSGRAAGDPGRTQSAAAPKAP